MEKNFFFDWANLRALLGESGSLQKLRPKDLRWSEDKQKAPALPHPGSLQLWQNCFCETETRQVATYMSAIWWTLSIRSTSRSLQLAVCLQYFVRVKKTERPQKSMAGSRCNEAAVTEKHREQSCFFCVSATFHMWIPPTALFSLL